MRFFAGVAAFPRGIRWFLSRPRYLALAFLPLVLGIATFVALGWWFVSHYHFIIEKLLPVGVTSWYGKVGLFLMQRLFEIAFFLFSASLSFLLTNIIASPLYDFISSAVERSVRGSAVEQSIAQSIGLIGEEIKKAAFILLISGLLMLIPGLNLLSSAVTAFLLGWNFYDYPLARRGLGFRDRLKVVWKDAYAVTGLGFWLIVPFVQFVTMPLAVAGGTLLALDSLSE